MTLTNKNILITGGAGFIGSHLSRSLADSNRVIVLDDLSSGFYANIEGAELEFVHGSILDDGLLETIFEERIDIVFHLAALFANQNSVEHPRLDLMTNGMGILKILEKSRDAGVERFVYTSSSCVYGDRKGRLSESCPLSSPNTPYAITKWLGEEYAGYFHRFYGLPVGIVRLFNCFGPGEHPGPYRNVIPNFLHRALSGLPLVVTGTGEETRDFNYVENTLQGLILTATREEAVGGTFNLGSGVDTTIRELAERINKLTGNTHPTRFIERRSWDKVGMRCADIDHSRSVLGYTPHATLDEGLKKTYRWFLENRPEIG